MRVISHRNSLLNSITYFISSVLVDPGDLWDGFGNVSAVLLTHAHFDHIYGLNELMEVSPQAKVFTNEIGLSMLLDARRNMSYYHETPFVFGYPDNTVVVEDGDEIPLAGGLVAKAVFTPGHNPSCVTWLVGDYIFTGDSLIPGIKTVTNLPGGDRRLAAESEKMISRLAEGRILCPGHAV